MNETKTMSVFDKTRVFNPLDTEQFAALQRTCLAYAESNMVPDEYSVAKAKSDEERKKAIGNCIVAADISCRIGAPLLMVMQNMVVVNGRPTWTAKFLLATINACGRFDTISYEEKSLGAVGEIEYTAYRKETVQSKYGNGTYTKNVPYVEKFHGNDVDNLQCVAIAIDRRTGKEVRSTPVSIRMAIEEGWYNRNGSKWKIMPQKMLRYRALSFFANEYAPEVSMGIYTTDEVQDMEPTVTVDGEYTDVTIQKETKRRMVDVPSAPEQKTANSANEVLRAPAPETIPIEQPKPQPQTTPPTQPAGGKSVDEAFGF